MTATLKNLAKIKKAERAKSTKIEHPLARYNNIGQLMCILCKQSIKSDALWNTHCATPSHKSNLIALQNQQQAQQAQQAQQIQQQAQKRKKIEEEEEINLKKAKLERNDFFEENTFKATPQIVKSQSSHPTNEIQQKVVQYNIPEGFFDDSKQQAQVYAASAAKQVKEVGVYLDQSEMDEEAALLKVLELRKTQANQVEYEIEDVDVDDIVEVEDFSLLPFAEIDKIIVEPVVIEQTKKDFEPIIEEFSHQPQIIENNVQEKIDSEIMKDVLSRREIFEKMKDLKQKHEVVSKQKSKSIDRTEKTKTKKKKNNNRIEEDDIEIDPTNFDFWRIQGI